jgi:hypothetical protein
MSTYQQSVTEPSEATQENEQDDERQEIYQIPLQDAN